MKPKRRSTPLLIPPTLAEVKLQAAKIGLPEREAEKFYWHYEKAGWKWGKFNVPISSWIAALQGWRLNWEEELSHREWNRKSGGSANDVSRELRKWKGER